MTALLRAAFYGLVLWANLAAGAAPVSAADYPNHPVRWPIGFAAGGPVDIVARIMSQWLSEHLGQQFVVENRSGSGGNLAAAAAINARPDGYTLLFVGPNNAISTSLYKKLTFDFMRDTVPVAGIMQFPNMLVVSNAMPVKTVQELIDYCRVNPGKVSFASAGYGTSVHMSAELFKALTRIDMVHVPYRGSALAFPDIMSNKVQLIFDTCRRRWNMCVPAMSAHSASPRRNAGPACPISRPLPKPCRASKPSDIMASPHPRARRRRSSPF
jgi:tripartite-type tricarboxylate transporter receptor subunit TctC